MGKLSQVQKEGGKPKTKVTRTQGKKVLRKLSPTLPTLDPRAADPAGLP